MVLAGILLAEAEGSGRWPSLSEFLGSEALGSKVAPPGMGGHPTPVSFEALGMSSTRITVAASLQGPRERKALRRFEPPPYRP